MTESTWITVVSGIPRSGTSMMMRMLETGGITPLTDRERTADDDNPNGYYELESVKQTATDKSWLVDAPGHSVKMIYSLLRDLPTDGRILGEHNPSHRTLTKVPENAVFADPFFVVFRHVADGDTRSVRRCHPSG
jgi:hypothetical protein